MKVAKKPAAESTARSGTFSGDEKAAMKERAREMKAARSGAPDGEGEVLAKIAEMAQPDRGMAERIHALVKANAPGLMPRLWYGMPAYANHDGVVCHFTPATKFKTRYGTLGFSDKAHLDDGGMWPSAFALHALGAADEAKIAALLKKAVK